MVDTATKAIEHVPFADRIKNMTGKQLREMASEEFALDVAETVKPAAIREQLLRVYEQRTMEAKTLNEQAAQIFLNANPDEKVVSVKFLPLDFPHAVVDFSNDCGFGIRGPNNETGLSKMPVFKLIPGEVYQLPVCVIRMLETKTFRDSKPTFDPVTGMIIGNTPIIKPRFMLQMVMSDEQMRAMGTTL